MITLVNGQLTDKISVYDRGLAYGDGVFETMLSFYAEIPLWDYHLARLKRSLSRLKINLLDSDSLKDIVKDHLDSSQQQIIKITVTRGTGPRGYSPSNSTEPTTIISVTDHNNKSDVFIEKGVKVSFCETCFSRQEKLAGLKHLNRLEQVLASTEFIDSGHDEGIMMDEMGNVISATMHNIFLVTDGALITPDLNYSGVLGVMREFVLSLAREEGIPVSIKDVSLSELLAANELFLTNSIHGIWPICELDSNILLVGKITSRLQSRVMEVMPYSD